MISNSRQRVTGKTTAKNSVEIFHSSQRNHNASHLLLCHGIFCRLLLGTSKERTPHEKCWAGPQAGGWDTASTKGKLMLSCSFNNFHGFFFATRCTHWIPHRSQQEIYNQGWEGFHELSFSSQGTKRAQVQVPDLPLRTCLWAVNSLLCISSPVCRSQYLTRKLLPIGRVLVNGKSLTKDFQYYY